MATRPILSTLDLRTQEERRGLSSSQRNIQAITGILQTLGKAEQARRERQQLDSIATAMQGGATATEAINAIINKTQETKFGGGVAGILQKAGGPFQPSPGNLRQSLLKQIIGTKLQQALASAEKEKSFTLGPGRERFTGAGESIAKVPPRPTELKSFTFAETLKVRKGIQEQIDDIEKRDIPGIGKGQRRNVYFQKDILDAYLNIVTGLGLNKKQQGQFDKIWDNKTKKLTPSRQQKDSEGNIIKIGWNPNSSEVKQARRELKAGVEQKATQEISDGSVRLQSAPDVRLDSVWDKLSTEQKKQILTQIDQNPENLDAIITNILARIQGAGA